MSEFVNYVCWSDAGVLASAPRDAANLGAGHFQAVHHPLRAKRGRLDPGHDGEGILVEERAVTDALRGAIGPDGYLLIPVVGGSGTGKSHLVKWVYEQTRGTPEWETRYLAKNWTSIRNVVELVLAGMRGPAIDAAREALESAPAHSESDETLGQRLLEELAHIVAEEPVIQPDTDRRRAQLREKLRGTLPDVLRDPVVGRRVTPAGAVIPRLVGLARSGRQDDDGLDNDAVRVVESDLPLTFDAIGDATRGVQRTLREMSTLPDLCREALEVINDALPRAVKRVFLSNNIDLVAILRDIRREIRHQGKELVLFIEDLTVLHGVEREFLDAIVEPASSPDGRLCDLRVLFAITRGHFDGLDTVRTRCSDAYWLDSTYGSDGIDLDEAVSFLGRYLNACRLDPQQLENNWTGSKVGTSIKNACHDCVHRDVCHDSFGVSSEGYGLYPFNRTAIDRLIGCLSALRFDPRQVVKALIEKFLPLSMVELNSTSFPSIDLMADFNSSSKPVRAEVVERLRREHGGEWERLVTLLRYWSEDREFIASSTPVIFGMAPLTNHSPVDVHEQAPDQSVAKPERRQNEEPDLDGIAIQLKSKRLRAYNELQRWTGQQQDLSIAVTNDLKKFIRDAVMDALDMGGVPLNLGAGLIDEHFNHELHIYFEGTRTSQGDRSEAIIDVRRGTETTVALIGLIVQGAPVEAQNPDDDLHRRALAHYLEEWTQAVTSTLNQIASVEAPVCLEGLLVASMVLGNCSRAKQGHDYLRLMLDVPTAKAYDCCSSEWQAAVTQAKEMYSRMRSSVEAYFGESRGRTGAVRAICADRMLPSIQEVLNRLDGGDLSSSDAPLNRLLLAVGRAVEKEWTLLSERMEEAVRLLESEESLDEQVERVKELAEAALRAGRFGNLGSMADIETLDTLPEGTLLSLRDATDAVGSEYTLTQRIDLLAGTIPANVLAASKFVERALGVMNAIEADLAERASSVSAPDELAATVSSIEQELTSLLEVVGGAVQ